MQYGHFDNQSREYVIDRVDLPVSWTNYIGVGDMYGVFNHTAGGYLLYRSPEYHRITRFRPNGVPMDGPGHYIYIRDNDTGDYWSVSWQPVGKDKKFYSCRHGLSYVKYLCDYSAIHAEQKLFVAMDEPIELWDIRLRNDSGIPRNLSVFSYLEFSFHQIQMDNQNFQMSLYASGSRYEVGVIENCIMKKMDSSFLRPILPLTVTPVCVTAFSARTARSAILSRLRQAYVKFPARRAETTAVCCKKT